MPSSGSANTEMPKRHRPAISNTRGARSAIAAADALPTLYPALRHSAATLLAASGLDAQLADDLVQEVTSRWFRRRMRFYSGGGMYVWLVRSIPLVLKEWQRRRRRHPEPIDMAESLEA